MREIKIPFVKTGSKIPVVSIILENGDETYALLDSGSESTLIDKDFILDNKSVFKVKRPKAKVSYIGLSNTSELPVVNAETMVKFGNNDESIKIFGEVFEFKFICSSFKETYNCSPKILIGSDTLETYNAKIDFENEELILNVDDILSK